ncbi:MAG: ATP-binding protein [Bacteroidia bacterium]
MNYSENIFGKSLTDLKYSDIEDFFQEEREESNIIEFKSFSTKHGKIETSLDGVFRGICAFLNSDGGILILGAPEGTKVEGKPEKVFFGNLSPVPQLIGKDQIMNKASDLISPLPIGVAMQTINKEGNYIYIFEVQKSSYSPHQFRNIYYARLDGQTKVAPHYLIEALFKKITFPQIEAFVNLLKIYHDGTNYLLDIEIYIFNFSPLQNEENMTYRVMCGQGHFAKSKNPVHQHMYSMGGHQLIHKGLIDILHFGSPDVNNETIVFNPHKLASNFSNQVDLIVTFGGKYSPLKASSYVLDLSRIDWNQPDNPNYLFKSIDENQLFADLQSKKGATKERLLKRLLNRQIAES